MTGSAPQATNLVVRFLLELCMLTALGYVGFQLGDGIVVRIGLAIALPLAAAVLWGAFFAPKARRRAPDPGRAVLEILLFTASAAGVAIAGHEVLGLILAVAVLINIGLMFVWGQRQTA